MTYSASELPPIDWSRPWSAPLQPLASRALAAGDWREALCALAEELELRNHRGMQIRFVPQHELPAGLAYEAFISSTGRVPTRNNLHDFFNGLIWLTFPAVKIQLNALQAAALEASSAAEQGGSCGRGMLRDAATIFDENGLLLLSDAPTLVQALRERRWVEVFVERRDEFLRHCRMLVFGHALLEKLVKPFKAITAHTYPVIVDSGGRLVQLAEHREEVDRLVARLFGAGLSTRDFMPIPVMGLPAWAEGQDRGFYEDAGVFRPLRLE